MPLDDDTGLAMQLESWQPRRRVAGLAERMILHMEARNRAKGAPWIIDHAGRLGQCIGDRGAGRWYFEQSVCSSRGGQQRVNTLGICEVMRGASPRSREESLRKRQSMGSSW